MTHVVLHIGTHKTGTTAIQNFLHDNAKQLRDNGVRYPLMPVRYERTRRLRNAGVIIYCVRERLGIKQLNDATLRANKKNRKVLRSKLRKKGGTFVLSDEQLWLEFTQYPSAINETKAFLTECGATSVQVVVYLRRQDEFILSLWNQRVKNGKRISISASEYIKRREALRVMDYAQGIRGLQEAFGAENVVVRVYDRSLFDGGDIRRDFCSYIGVDPDAGFSYGEGDPNPALNNNLADIKRHANSVEAYCQGENFLMGPAQSATMLAGRDSASPLAPEERRNILERYKEGNEWIAREILGREDGVLFAQPEEYPAAWEFEPVTYSRDIIRFFTEALTEERANRLKAEERIEQLERRLSNVELATLELDGGAGGSSSKK